MARLYYAALAAALCGCVCFGVVQVSKSASVALDAWGQAPESIAARADAAIAREAAITRFQLAIEMQRWQNIAIGTVMTLDGRLESVQKDLDMHVGGLRLDAQRQLDAANRSLAEVAKLRGDVRPVLNSADELLQQSSGTVAVLRPQLLGLIAATKVTAGEAAQASKTFNERFPHIVATIERIGANSDRTTAATAQLTQNLATATSPLPKWMRWGLAIVPPIAGAGSSAVGMAAAAGAFRR